MGGAALGDQQHAGRVAVEPVDQAGAHGRGLGSSESLATGRGRAGGGRSRRRALSAFRQVPGERVDQRTVAIAAGRMDHQAGRLVERQQVLVLVEDRQRQALCR